MWAAKATSVVHPPFRRGSFVTVVPCLNLGAGDDIREDAVNLDIRRLAGVDTRADIRSLPFQTAVFEQVIAQDCIEHVRYCEVDEFLEECYRVLAPGGELLVRTPNFQWILDNIEYHYEHPVRLQRKLYGGHTYPRENDEDYEENTHMCIFTPELLKDHLDEAGFRAIYTRTDMAQPNHWNLGARGLKPE